MPAAAVLLLLLSSQGCANVRVNTMADETDPLREFVLEQGEGRGKVLIIPLRGFISDMPEFGLLRTKPSMVQEFMSQLRFAENDKNIKTILLVVNSPGGTTTGSDIIYHEIEGFKKKHGTKIVVCMMDIATSGGYYVSLPADCIYAHPTTLTGSIGVVFFQPKLQGLMGKIGIDMAVTKSGAEKDMGSPFRQSTEQENKIFQGVIDQLAAQFLTKLRSNRKISEENIKAISSARVYLADDALKLGMIDKIGYLKDAIAESGRMAGLGERPNVIVYRRMEYPNDNIYNTSVNKFEGSGKLLDLGVLNSVTNMTPGFYYLWTPGAGLE
ncbi:MAG: signal peptidase [Lentisphaerae bacterium GWF2_52_8]|nr:MAG: signal peptidase [Lentisphaerae bacterium GWF2_52_8]